MVNMINHVSSAHRWGFVGMKGVYYEANGLKREISICIACSALTPPRNQHGTRFWAESLKETIVFQPSIFRCELLVLGRVVLRVFTPGSPKLLLKNSPLDWLIVIKTNHLPTFTKTMALWSSNSCYSNP